MVCARCIIVIESILQNLGIENYDLSMGQISFKTPLTKEKLQALRIELEKVGFAIVEDKAEKIIEAIKVALINYLNALQEGSPIKMSAYITQEVNYEYSYASDLFSKTENKTIEKYFIELRLDKTKELLKYTSLDLSSIAYQLGYSSPQHFANQFKQHIGITPRAFRKTYKIQ